LSEPLPVIGITTYSRNEAGEFYLPGAYIDAVQLAGGMPILLPPNQPAPEQLFGFLDGLIFSGGGDLDPQLYGGDHHSSIYLVDPDRDAFELTLAKVALTATIPVLGICRGMQVLSVASGADLITHVPDVYGDTIAHRLDHPRRPIAHAVQITPNSRLANMLGQINIAVVSWHHQAIKTIPPGWAIVAQAQDGLPEALEFTSHPWMFGVQWHPELSPDEPVHQRLFQALIKAVALKDDSCSQRQPEFNKP
jgi:putative glutamine amidotransferase